MDIQYWRSRGYDVEIESLDSPYASLYQTLDAVVARYILIGEQLSDIDKECVGVMKWTGKIGKEYTSSISKPKGEWISIENFPPILDTPPLVWNSTLKMIGYLDPIHERPIILWPPEMQNMGWLYKCLKVHYSVPSMDTIDGIFDIEYILDMDRCIQEGYKDPDTIYIYDRDVPCIFSTIPWDNRDKQSKCIWIRHKKILRSRDYPYLEGLHKKYIYLSDWDIPEEIYHEARENDYHLSFNEDMSTATLSNGHSHIVITEDADEHVSITRFEEE